MTTTTIDQEAVERRIAKGKRIRARSMSPMEKGGRRVRVGSQRSLLSSFIQAHARQFPTEYRLIQAAQGHPLPARECLCSKCDGKRQGWPAGYVWTATRKGWGESYECGLHRQSEWFLMSLPSSASIVRYK